MMTDSGWIPVTIILSGIVTQDENTYVDERTAIRPPVDGKDEMAEVKTLSVKPSKSAFDPTGPIRIKPRDVILRSSSDLVTKGLLVLGNKAESIPATTLEGSRDLVSNCVRTDVQGSRIGIPSDTCACEDRIFESSMSMIEGVLICCCVISLIHSTFKKF